MQTSSLKNSWEMKPLREQRQEHMKMRNTMQEEPIELDSGEATRYRACAARCNFLALGRPDIAYVVKEACRARSKPTNHDRQKLKHIVRYIKLHPRAVFTWKFQRRPTTVTVFSDTNYAGCLNT